MSYLVGQTAVVTVGPIVDVDNVAFDPTNLTVTWTDPTGHSTMWAYPADLQITKTAVGVYVINLPLTIEGRWLGVWSWGTDDQIGASRFTLTADDDADDTFALTPTYCTVAQFRNATRDDASLTDEQCVERIVQAEDLIDRILGGWWPNETNRKVLQAYVLPWQWNKLTRATVLLAARLYANPKILSSQQFQSVHGPDFSFTGPYGGPINAVFGQQVLGILDDSGLRQLAGRATQGARTSPRRARFRQFFEDFT